MSLRICHLCGQPYAPEALSQHICFVCLDEMMADASGSIAIGQEATAPLNPQLPPDARSTPEEE